MFNVFIDFKVCAKFCDTTAIFLGGFQLNPEEKRNLHSHEVDNSDLQFLHRV